MSFLDGLRHRFKLFTHPREQEQELADELAFHVEREAAQQVHDAATPLSEKEALRAARRRVGNLTHAQEETRRASGLAALDVVAQDIRFAIRSFRSTPAFTIIVVTTLAIGIGATTAIFSAVDALLLRPLPFQSPSELMSVSLVMPAYQARPRIEDGVWSYPKFQAFRSAQRLFSDATLWTQSQFTLRGNAESHRISGEYIDSHFFPTLGVPLALGRNFSSEEDRNFGGPQVAILGNNIWKNSFNRDSTIIGSRIEVDGRPYTVIGVGAEGFHGVSGEVELWMPITSAPSNWGASNPYSHSFFAIARRAPGITSDAVMAAMPQLGAQVDEQYPDQGVANYRWSATARTLDSERIHPDVRRILFILLGAVSLVLLTACANVANLLLVRASSRRREVAVRLALGATRSRLVRQFLIESLLLAVVGGAASLIVGFVAIHMLASVQTLVMGQANNATGMGTAYFSTPKLDWIAFAVTGSLAVLAGVMFGLAPALQATRASVIGAIKGGDNTMTIGRHRLAPRNILTVVQISFAVALLAVSGLMIRSINHLLEMHLGYEAESVLSLRVNRAPEWARDSIDTFYDQSLERIAQLPGVAGAAMGDCPPLVHCNVSGVIRTDLAAPEPSKTPRAGMHWITPDWFTVLRIPLIRGRTFTRGDDGHSGTVVVISQTAGREIWPGEDPIGRSVKLQMDGMTGPATVVGIVGDVTYASIDSLPKPEVYVSYFQTHFTYRMMFFVRAKGPVAPVVKSVTSTLRSFAPGFPLYDVQTLPGRISDATAYARITTAVLAMFATVTLILAMIGTYGVVSFAVSQRTREIGVRFALGATNGDISRLIIWQGVSFAVTGLCFGLVFALIASRAIRSFLFGVTPADPVTLGVIILTLGVSVLLATWIPARRAIRVKPATVLRAQ